MCEVYNFTQEVIMKNNRPPILQSDWSIASRHGRNNIMTLSLIIIRDIHYYFYSTTNISM